MYKYECPKLVPYEPTFYDKLSDNFLVELVASEALLAILVPGALSSAFMIKYKVLPNVEVFHWTLYILGLLIGLTETTGKAF